MSLPRRTPLQRAVLATLAYADQFAYPLMESEIWQRLINVDQHADVSQASKADFRVAIQALAKERAIVKEWHYWCLAGSELNTPTRRQRAHWTNQSWFLAEEVRAAAQLVPWVEAVAVTGAMAVANPSSPDDDMDILVVTQPRRLWLSRLWLSAIAWNKGRRRSWHGEEKNSWCLNMWLDTDHLEIPANRHSFYVAHEVMQTKWLGQRSAVDHRFYRANQWVTTWLPHAKLESDRPSVMKWRKRKQPLPIVGWLASWVLDRADELAFWLQYHYMKNHITREVIGLGLALFHPRDTKKMVETRWQRTMKVLDRA